MTYSAGTILLDKYRIEALIGQGAFGDVYRVRHATLNVLRAIKVLRHDDLGIGSTIYTNVQQRFQLEGQLGAQLNTPVPNPHLLQVYDFIIREDLLILEMEYAAGGSLVERIQKTRETRSPFPIEQALQIGVEVAAGLGALHALDIVHRDLKPANLLFDEHGHVRLADLGLAQIPGGPSRRSQFSDPQPHPGTPGYMSPEQENSGSYLTSASDVYSLGVTLFELLTGRVYRGLRPGSRARALRSDIPAALDELLGRMLSENQRDRPWDGVEASDLLQEVLQPKQHGQRGVEDQARLEAELRAKAEAEEKVRQAEEKRRQTEIKVQAEATARLEAERKAKREAEEKRRELTIDLGNGVSMEFVRVPAGKFLMGSDPGKDKQTSDDETPQHTVVLDEYRIGKYPVTNRQYQVFVQAAGYRSPGHWSNGEFPSGNADHPVTYVSWEDASAFCKWASTLNQTEVRLPTEAEWEKAARGPDGRIYPWGDKIPDKKSCNFNNNIGDTSPVGNYSPQGDGPYGCADLAGNVWEWVADWYDEGYYKKSPANNPGGPDSGSYRVMRGGSWFDVEYVLRVSCRNWGAPDLWCYFIGFRCAC